MATDDKDRQYVTELSEGDTPILNNGVSTNHTTANVIKRNPSSSRREGDLACSIVICVICLEVAEETATSVPCQHAQFHFPCLGTWLQQNTTCPLCKSQVTSVILNDSQSRCRGVYHVPQSNQSPATDLPPLYHYQRRRSSRRLRGTTSRGDIDPVIKLRRHIYHNRLYSLYVGNNRVSGYRNFTPASLSADPSMLQRARKWIRRELRVLDPFRQYSPEPSTNDSSERRSSFQNIEFLLEYVIAILKHIDLKGSAGQAESLLADHLDRETASLFMHELANWLRSPFETLEEYDRFVQYPEPLI